MTQPPALSPAPAARSPRSLLVMNAALLILLAGVTVTQSIAQPGDTSIARARGDYTMVAGKSNIGGGTVAYVVDGANQEVIALKWDQTKQQMLGVGYRSLGGDTKTSAPAR